MTIEQIKNHIAVREVWLKNAQNARVVLDVRIYVEKSELASLKNELASAESFEE